MKLFKKDGAWITREVHEVNQVCTIKMRMQQVNIEQAQEDNEACRGSGVSNYGGARRK